MRTLASIGIALRARAKHAGDASRVALRTTPDLASPDAVPGLPRAGRQPQCLSSLPIETVFHYSPLLRAARHFFRV
jgi:hypothetical protein